MKKLSGVEVALANFFASGLLELGDKLGPILWQLPATSAVDPMRLEAFLRILPRSHASIAETASLHTREGIEPVLPRSDAPVRHVLEFRNSSLFSKEVKDLVTKFEVCLAASHSSRWPYFEADTADFMYFRLHGPGDLYGSSYSDGQLRDLAVRAASWQTSKSPMGAPFDVYVYFDNDGHAHAPHNAFRLQELVATHDA